VIAWLIISIGSVLVLAHADNISLNSESGIEALAYTLAGVFIIIGWVFYMRGVVS
jgi:hypothetical protein